MSNSIVITLPHRFGAEEAKRRIAGGIELLRRDYIDKLAYSEVNWNGRQGEFPGSGFWTDRDGATLRHGWPGHSSRLAESGRLVRRMSHHVDPAAIAEEARTVRLDAVLGPPRHIQALHRARQRMVNHRTAAVSQIRGLLLDRGFAIAKSITRARRAIPEILAGQDNELTAMARDPIAELYDLFRDLDRRIGLFDRKIDRIFHGSEACQRIARIKGVGPKTATAIVAAIGDGSEFKNGRHLAAWVRYPGGTEKLSIFVIVFR
jgi:hypothetical protein